MPGTTIPSIPDLFTPDRSTDPESTPDPPRSFEEPTVRGVLDRLSTVEDSRLGDDVVSMGLVDDVRVRDDAIALRLGLYAPHAPAENRILEDARTVLEPFDREVLTFAGRVRRGEHDCLPSRVRNVIAFVGAREGCGTTTTAANVASALARRGAAVGFIGILDHGNDVVGTIPTEGRQIPGRDRREGAGHGDVIPPTVRDVEVMTPAIRRRLSVEGEGVSPSTSLEPLLSGVVWSELDYLIVDLSGGLPTHWGELFGLTRIDGTVFVAAQDTPPRRLVERIRVLEMRPPELLGVVETKRGSVRGEFRRLFGLDVASEVTNRDRTRLLGSIPRTSPLEGDAVDGVIQEDAPIASLFDMVSRDIIDEVGTVRRRRHARKANA